MSSLLPLAAVTGAGGLIGKYIVTCLQDQGWKVRVLSRQENVLRSKAISIVVGSISDTTALSHFVNGADAVFHCAAELHDELKMYDVNVTGTANLLKVIQASKSIKYFCYLSSVGVVGSAHERMVEEHIACKPSNEYERTKYKAEKLVLAANLGGMKVCVLRPGNVFDAERPGLVGLVLQNSLRNKVALFFKGNERAHLVHAKDVASAAVFFMGGKLAEPEVFFLSYDDNERNTTLDVCRLCLIINKLANTRLSISLPSHITYLIRNIFKGKGLHGRVRFSGEKLRNTGFTFPLGLEKALAEVCSKPKVINK